MKTITMLLMAMLLQGGELRAADAHVFEGVNLHESGQTQRLKDMPELYELDPATRRYRLLKPVIQIPLSGAWLTFNAESNVFYLNKVPGQNEATYFGPIAGDAFEVFKLEERFLQALRKDHEPDVPYRLALMMRTGHPKLRERALRLMIAALSPEISVATRASHLPRFSEFVAEEGDDAAPLRAAIAATEKAIEDSTVKLPDSEYSPGNDELASQGRLQDWMKIEAAGLDLAWGEALGGLRAAAMFSTNEAKPGEEISVWLLVENVGDKEVRFAFSDVMQTARPKIIGPDGKEIQARSSWYTGLSPIQRHKLRPGERLTLAKKKLVFDDKAGGKNPGFGENRAAVVPGEYRVRHESILGTGSSWGRGEGGKMQRTLPAKGEWNDRLSTGETKITVRAD